MLNTTSIFLRKQIRNPERQHSVTMKSIISAAAAALGLYISTTYALQSKPFFLVLHSDDKTLNGKTLGACHEGAAYEGLCVDVPLAKAKSNYNTFTFNYTKSEPNFGSLNWKLVGSGFECSSSPVFYATTIRSSH